MRVPLILFLASLIATAAFWGQPGLGDLGLLAALCAIASLFLVLRAVDPEVQRRRRGRPKPGSKDAHWIVVDGSNVMHWRDNEPKIETVREVVRHLSELGYTPGVMFDANAGYLLFEAYKHDGAMSRQLGLPKDRVMVVPSGVPADRYILTAAREMGARVVTNDRFREWAGDHPEVLEPGHLVKGGYEDGKLWLAL